MQPNPQAEDDPDVETARVYGVIDVIRADRIAGWAIDRADSRAALEVDILREGRCIATARADRDRPDLAKNGIGTGAYGFSAAIDPPLEPGLGFTLRAQARAADGAQAELKRAGAAAAPSDPSLRLLERLHLQLGELTRSAARREPDDTAALSEVMARVEVAQARLEALIERGAAAGPGPSAGLKLIVGCSLTVGLISLALGLYSMWQP